MFRNRLIRRMAIILGILGRTTGLSSIPSMQGLYNKLASYFVPNEDVWVTMDNQEMLIPNPYQHVLGRMIYLHGAWEGVVTRVLCDEVKLGMTTLDIGAHVGYYTLLMAKRVGKEGRVFAFEPNPVVRKYIEQNVQRNGYAQVEITPYALFSKGGFGILEGRDNLNSCLSLQSAPTDRSIQIAVFDQVKKDLGIDRVDLIKMDVEGAELDILHGMRGLIEKHHPSLIIEVHRNGLIHFQHSESELREYLKSFGYTMKDIWSQIGTITVLGKWKAPEK